MTAFWIVFIGINLILPIAWVAMPKPSSRHARHKQATVRVPRQRVPR